MPDVSDWTSADWHDRENLSALWDLSGHLTGTLGQVLWTRGTEPCDVKPPFDRFQSVIVENAEQLDGLIKTLNRMCEDA